MADVVLIDDDPDIRMLATMALELEGHDVVEASGGTDGLAAVRAAVAGGVRPVVVLDVQMPDLDGWEVLAALRDDAATERLPVIMCTVRAGTVDREKGFTLGADAYQAKPFDLEQLLEVVNRLAALEDDELLARRTEVSSYIAGDEESTV